MSSFNLELIPVSAEKENEINQYFSGTMFGSVQTFVGMFNSGMLNRGFGDTREMAEKVQDAFSNVSVSRSAIVVQTPQEFKAGRLAEIFDSWRSITRLRREIDEQIALNPEVFNDETLLFIEKKGGVYRIDAEKVYSTPLSRVTKDASRVLFKASTVFDDENERDTENDYNYSESDESDEFHLSLDSDDTENDADTENDTDDETKDHDDTEREIPENAKARTVKLVDIKNLDDSFINDVYDLVV